MKHLIRFISRNLEPICLIVLLGCVGALIGSALNGVLIGTALVCVTTLVCK